MKAILLIPFAYLIGSIPTGVIVSKIIGGRDPRLVGSGNIGATNVLRSGGKKAGIITLLGDIAKGAFPVFLALQVSGSYTVIGTIAFSAFLGHLYPIFLGFRGGKGVATAAGIFLVISPLAFFLASLVFTVIVIKTRYVSLGSLGSGLSMPLLISLFTDSKAYILLSLLITVFILYKHKDNIKRIIEGRENRIDFA